jgi:collagenase-like PrtC family protease
VCEEDPDGMVAETLDGDAFLAFSGPMIFSYTFANLVRELEELCAMGVERFRLSPQDVDMVAVARLFRDVLDGVRAPAAAFEMLGGLVPGTPFSNGFYHGVEGAALSPPSGPTS